MNDAHHIVHRIISNNYQPLLKYRIGEPFPDTVGLFSDTLQDVHIGFESV